MREGTGSPCPTPAGTINQGATCHAVFFRREGVQFNRLLAVNDIHFESGVFLFGVTNLGQIDVSDIGIDVVPNDCYSQREYLRLPWLSAGESEKLSVALHFERGDRHILVAVDPVGNIIEFDGDRGNSRPWLNNTIAQHA